MKRSMTGQGTESLVAFGMPRAGTSWEVVAPEGHVPTLSSLAAPSLIPFSAGIALCSSTLGFLAISNSSHLCIQDSKDCNKGKQHVNPHGGCTTGELCCQLQRGPRKVVSTSIFLGMGVTQALPKAGVLPEGEE